MYQQARAVERKIRLWILHPSNGDRSLDQAARADRAGDSRGAI
jgi:hypothetical protein